MPYSKTFQGNKTSVSLICMRLNLGLVLFLLSFIMCVVPVSIMVCKSRAQTHFKINAQGQGRPLC